MTGTAPDRGRRAGFSLVELLLILVMISLIAAIAVPNLQRAVLRARAADALSDLNVVKVAVLNYQGHNTAWPPDDGAGQVPAGLETYLPDGFSFTDEDYELDYENWTGASPGIVAVTLVTSNEELGLAVLDMLGTNSWTDGAQKYTWVIEWID